MASLSSNVEGVFLSGLHPSVTVEYLLLYFESKRSGGDEESVIEEGSRVFVNTKGEKCGIVLINNPSVVQRILDKPQHIIHGQDATVEAYIPCIHDNKIGPSIHMTSESATRSGSPAGLRMKAATLTLSDTLPEANVGKNPIQQARISVLYEGIDFPQNKDTTSKRIAISGQHRWENLPTTSYHSSCAPEAESSTAIYPTVDTNKPRQEDKPVMGAKKRNRRKGRWVRDASKAGKEMNSSAQSDNSFTFTESIPLKHSEIIMLRISAFAKKNGSDKVRIKLNENDCNVCIKCTSKELLDTTKWKLKKDLERVVCQTKAVSAQTCKYLERPAVKQMLTANCVQKKMYVHIEAESDRDEVIVYALSDSNSKQGMTFFEENWHRKNIKIRDGQEDLMKSQKWNHLEEQLNARTTLVFFDVSTNSIYIECIFEESKVQEAFRQVLEFLKTSKPSCEILLQLKGIKGDFFNKQLRTDIETMAIGKQISLYVTDLGSSPASLYAITLKGDKELVEKVQCRIANITSQKVPFEKLTSGEPDRYQVMKGLDTPAGRTFLAEFEKIQDCLVTMETVGQLDIGPQRVEELFDVEEETPQPEVSPPTSSSSGIDVDPARTAQEKLSQRGPFSFVRRSVSTGIKRDMFDVEKEMSHPSDFLQRSHFRHAQEMLTQIQPVTPIRRSKSAGLYEPDMAGLPAPEPFTVGHTHVEIKKGHIQKEKTDGIVNIASPAWNICESAVSKALLSLAGPGLQQETQLALAEQGPGCHVISSNACGMLQCQNVFHVRMAKGEENSKQSIQSVMAELNVACRRNNVESLAIPPLGVGRMYKYSAAKAARYIRRYIEKYLTAVKRVVIVIYPDDSTTYEKFIKQFSEDSTALQKPALLGQEIMQNYQNPFFKRQPDNYGMTNCDPFGLLHRPANFGQRYEHLHPSPLTASRPPPSLHRLKTQESLYDNSSDEDDVLAVSETRKYPYKYVGHQAKTIARPTNFNLVSPSKAATTATTTTVKVKPQTRSTMKPQIRTVQEKPINKLEIMVCAKDLEACKAARHALEKRLLEEFLHEKQIKQIAVSRDSLDKINSMVLKGDVRAIREKNVVVLRGYRQNVEQVYSQITNILIDNSKYKTSTKEEMPKVQKPQKGTAKYIQYMAFDAEPEVPLHWQHFKPLVPIASVMKTISYESGKKFKAIGLRNDHQASQTIMLLMHQTFRSELVGHGRDAAGLGGYSQLRVLRVERIENIELFNEYSLQRKALFRSLHASGRKCFPAVEDLPGSSGAIKIGDGSALLGEVHPEVNEVYLFHGTKPENIKNICSNGLDSRLSGVSAMFGPGVYGAETSMKADQYVDDKQARTIGAGHEKKLFIIRMLLGNCYLCTVKNPPKFRTPPCAVCQQPVCKQHETMFDSVIGDCGLLNREFVVYKHSQCYPEYIVTYERV